MTIAQLLSMVKTMYPSATSDADIVRYFNMAQDELSHYFGLVATNSTLVTVADQDEYALPTGIEDISQIEALDIGNGVTPVDRYDYSRYEIGFRDDAPMQGNCIYQGYSSAGVKSLIIYPAPMIADYPIRIRYKKKLTDLSITDQSKSPEFDSRYHDLLASYACFQICANGASPDTIQANRFGSEYEQGVNELWKHQNNEKIKSPRKRKENRMWTGSR